MLKAYHLMPEPALLFIVAKIYQKMNESALAEKYYRKFIEEDEADPEKVKEALAQISAIQEAQKKQTAEAQAEKEKAAALEQEQQALAEKAAAKKRAEDEANATCLPCWLASGMTVGTVGVASAMGYLALEERKIFDTTLLRAKDNKPLKTVFSMLCYRILPGERAVLLQ